MIDPRVTKLTQTKVYIEVGEYEALILDEDEARSVLTQLADMFDFELEPTTRSKGVSTCNCDDAPHGYCPKDCPNSCCS